MYTCVVCSIQHFSSASKYDSGSGWPSFFDIIDKKKIRLRKDASGGLCIKQSFLADICINLLFCSGGKPFADNRGPEPNPDGGLLCRMRSSPWSRFRGWTKTHRTQVTPRYSSFQQHKVSPILPQSHKLHQ